MHKIICVYISLLVCVAKGFENNDTLKVERIINETTVYGFSKASKDSSEIHVALSMTWNDSILPACKIDNWYRYGKTVVYDTSRPTITYRPLDMNHMSIISSTVTSTGSSMDMMVTDENGEKFGFGYNTNINLTPTRKNAIIVDYEGRFTPWGHGYTQRYKGTFSTEHDTIIISKLKYGIMRIQVDFK